MSGETGVPLRNSAEGTSGLFSRDPKIGSTVRRNVSGGGVHNAKKFWPTTAYAGRSAMFDWLEKNLRRARAW